MFIPVAYEEKLLVNAATLSQENKIVAKINDSLLYSSSYGKTELDNYFWTQIHQNGYLNQSLLSSSGTFFGTNDFHLFINISTYQEHEAGEYFVIVYTDIFALYYTHACPAFIYLDFVDYYLSIIDIVWQVEILQIQTSGK